MTEAPKITLEKVRIFASMSEETTCFEAMLRSDGVAMGRVSNRGTGGCHEYGFDTRALDQRFREAGIDRKLGEGDSAITVPLDLDGAVDEALERHLALKQVRLKVLALSPANGKLYEFPRRRGETKEAVENWIRRRKPNLRLLADMSEEEQIEALLRSA